MKNILKLTFIIVIFNVFTSVLVAQNGKLITATSTNFDNETVFWVSSNGDAWRSDWQKDCPFSTPMRLGAPNTVSPNGMIQSCTYQTNSGKKKAVVCIGKDGAVYFYTDNPQNSLNFTTIGTGASTTGSVIISSRKSYHIDVFWITASGKVMQNWASLNDAGVATWGGAGERSNANSLSDPSGSLATISREAEHLDLFWINTQGAIVQTWWKNSGNFTTPSNITNINVAHVKSGLAAVSRYPNSADVFWINNSGAIMQTYWQAGSPFRTPGAIPNATAKPTSALTYDLRTPENLDIFYIGTDNKVKQSNWNDNNGRFGTGTVAPASVVSNSSVTCKSRTKDIVNVYWIDNNGKIMQAYWYAGLSDWARGAVTNSVPATVGTISGKITIPKNACKPNVLANPNLLKSVLKINTYSGNIIENAAILRIDNATNDANNFYFNFQITNVPSTKPVSLLVDSTIPWSDYFKKEGDNMTCLAGVRDLEQHCNYFIEQINFKLYYEYCGPN
jgi:hypothetical protein